MGIPKYVAISDCHSTFTENTGKLHIEEMRVPDPFIFGSAAELGCAYAWEGPGSARRHLYSVKWFKDNEEFYR